MVCFSDWLAVESFVDVVDLNVARKRAFVETMTVILGIINEGLDDEDEEEDAPEEVDDPFTGGEDAKPSFEAPSKSKEEHLRAMLEALKLIRKNAMAQRAQKVEKIRELLASHSSDMDNDDDLADALPDLVDLGYIKPAKAKTIRRNIDLPESDPKNKKAWEALEERATAASREQGNGSINMAQAEHAKMEEAKKKLYDAIVGVYGDKLERIVARNQRFAGEGIGHQHYEESEIANEMFMYILRLVSQRRWQDGKILPWGGEQPVIDDEGKKKKQRGQEIEGILKSSGDEKDLERMYAYFSSSAKSTATKIRRSGGSQLNPSSRGRVKSDIHTNKDKKAKRIKDDIKSGELDFYRDYLRKANERPLDQRSHNEELVSATTDEDKTRLAIMKAIEYEYNYKPSSRELFSIGEDDDAIKKTLLNYVSHYLRRGEKSVTHASTLVGDSESSDDAVLSGVKAAFKKHDEPPENSNPMDSAERSESSETSRLIFDFFLPYIVESINEISKEGLRPSTEGLFVFDRQPKMNGKVKVYVPGGIDEATMNSINIIIDNKLKQESEPAPERSRYKKLSADSANSYWVHESIFNDFLQAFKSKGKRVELESASGAPGLESFGSKGNRGSWEALALCIKFNIRCSVRTEIRRGEIVPVDVVAQAEQSIDINTKEYMANIFKNKMKKGWDWDAFCREAFKNYGLNSYQVIAEKWTQYPPESNQKLSPRNLRSMAEYLEGTPTMSSEGGLIKLCNKMAEKIKF